MLTSINRLGIPRRDHKKSGETTLFHPAIDKRSELDLLEV